MEKIISLNKKILELSYPDINWYLCHTGFNSEWIAIGWGENSEYYFTEGENKETCWNWEIKITNTNSFKDEQPFITYLENIKNNKGEIAKKFIETTIILLYSKMYFNTNNYL